METIYLSRQRYSDFVIKVMNYYSQIGVPTPSIKIVDNRFISYDYIEGESLSQQTIIEVDSIKQIVDMVKQMHCTPYKSKSLNKGNDYYLRTIRTPNIISHCDITPENVIFKDGKLVGLIDWELAGEVNSFVELAKICWLFTRNSDDRMLRIKYIIKQYGCNETMILSIMRNIVDIITNDIILVTNNGNHINAIEWRKEELNWFTKQIDDLEEKNLFDCTTHL